MNRQYAIFDMDGTLIDSMVIWDNIAREYLESRGLTQNLDDILQRIVPMTMTDAANLFISEFSLNVTAKEICDEIMSTMISHYENDIPLKPSVAKYLQQLKQDNVKMCVASASSEMLIETALKRLGVLHYFDFIISCETVGVGKTSPDIYIAAAQKFHVSPEQVAVYEDAPHAVKTAKQACFYVIGVYDLTASEHWDEICSIADETIIFS